MEAFLGFLATEGGRLDPLLRVQYRIEDGGRAYSEIQKSGAYTAILKYDPDRSVGQGERNNLATVRKKTDVLRVGCIGAGSFARGIIFPQLQALKNVQLDVVGTASGASAFSAQKSFGFRRAESPSEILADANVDAIFILSHHDSPCGPCSFRFVTEEGGLR